MSHMKDRRKDERPREKLAQKGVAALSDYELLVAIIGSGNKYADVTKIAHDVRKLIVDKASELRYEDLLQIKSLGPAKATNIMAGYELWRRQFEVPERPIIDSPDKAVAQLGYIRSKKQEYFVCLTLDGANRLVTKRIISIGTLTASLVHPREVFAEAITDRAASVIVAHNHPSGSLEASEADRAVTQRLIESGSVLGISVKYHVVLTKDSYTTIN
ncbi:MAG: DNA repair protein RadC [Candidatus Saccharimonadales bacterium]